MAAEPETQIPYCSASLSRTRGVFVAAGDFPPLGALRAFESRAGERVGATRSGVTRGPLETAGAGSGATLGATAGPAADAPLAATSGALTVTAGGAAVVATGGVTGGACVAAARI